VEIIGLSGFDFAVLDVEHAPFDVASLDVSILAGLSVGLPVLVRVPATAPFMIGTVLDLGATGVVIPHVVTADGARTAVAAARFAGGSRGLSPSCRAASYGNMIAAAFVELADRCVTVWVQIEDRQALNDLDAIAATSGVDCLFVGRVDLAQSLGKLTADDPALRSLTARVAKVARNANSSVALFVSSVEEARSFDIDDITIFIVGTDQAYLKAQSNAVYKSFRSLANR
jgi:2-keto-3-deoxy-L-rhamnonate aldolase RhmA